MTMNLIKHGTPRAGFKDWPTYNNKTGKEEPEIARCAYPDPDWEKETPPKTDNTSKSITGEKIANKIRDLRLRRSLTGTTANPRLSKKTSAKAIEEQAQVDFEDEIRKYKEDIADDIHQYKNQPYCAPEWVRAEVEAVSKTGASSSSSSSWEAPLSDSQAVNISDFLLNEQETREFLAQDEESDTIEGPAWEHNDFIDKKSYEYPYNLQPYGPEAYGAFWEQWLEELTAPTPHDYYQRNAASVIEEYDKRRDKCP